MSADLANKQYTKAVETCWCGSADLAQAIHPDYLICQTCGTAKLKSGRTAQVGVVQDEQSHLYGETYWHEHQAQLGLAPIEVRARTDLAERAQYWLAHLLKYRLPPGRVLEIGCSHGGFLKLLGMAGFEATGIEMSPRILERARGWFGVHVVQGPLEPIAPSLGRFDVIALFDVAEHLTDPEQTFSTIADQLSPDGILALQTPRHDNVRSLSWPMYVPPEHTFLFSSTGIQRLLAGFGLTHVVFEPPMFGYDMFVFASRQPLSVHAPEAIANRLVKSTNGRMVLAMLDLFQQLLDAPNWDLHKRYGTKQLGKWFLRSLWRSLVRRFQPDP